MLVIFVSFISTCPPCSDDSLATIPDCVTAKNSFPSTTPIAFNLNSARRLDGISTTGPSKIRTAFRKSIPCLSRTDLRVVSAQAKVSFQPCFPPQAIGLSDSSSPPKTLATCLTASVYTTVLTIPPAKRFWESCQGVIRGNPELCLPHVLNVLDGIDSEALMISVKHPVAMSNGSVCTSQNHTPSHVLKAMDLPIKTVSGAVEISWNHMSPNVDWTAVADAIGTLRQLLPNATAPTLWRRYDRRDGCLLLDRDPGNCSTQEKKSSASCKLWQMIRTPITSSSRRGVKLELTRSSFRRILSNRFSRMLTMALVASPPHPLTMPRVVERQRMRKAR